MTTISLPPTASALSAPETDSLISASRPVMWPVYATLFSSLCIVVGLIWDISWHRTVGRDTFWTYPHVLEQVAAIVSGLSCGWLVLHTTFAKTPAANAMREVSIRVWGFRGPLGAWVCIWGTVMMIVSAPFDDWWHNAYGLDVKIISPPHMVLALGMIAIEVGALLMALAVHNRASIRSASVAVSESRLKFNLMYVIAAGVIIAMLATAILELAGFANTMHGSPFYQVTGALFPIVLIATARGANLRWAATSAATAYMIILLGMIWTLQLFHGTPMLAPIHNPVTHMVPPPFPYLLIVPAVLIDLLLSRIPPGREWRTALLTGVVFMASFLAVQWFFADFLLSPYARNFFFAADKWDYYAKLGDWRYQYWTLDRGDDGRPSLLAFAQGMAVATTYTILSARAGLGLGNAMRRVLR